MHCTECGSKIKKTNKYCGTCGSSLSTIHKTEKETNQNRPKKNDHYIEYAMFSLVGFSAACYILVFFPSTHSFLSMLFNVQKVNQSQVNTDSVAQTVNYEDFKDSFIRSCANNTGESSQELKKQGIEPKDLCQCAYNYNVNKFGEDKFVKTSTEYVLGVGDDRFLKDSIDNCLMMLK